MTDLSVLIVSYHYPPGPSVGWERVVKFEKFLPEFGVRTVTLASRVHGRLPTDVECDVHRPLEPALLYRWLLKTLRRRDTRPAGAVPGQGHGLSAGTRLQPFRDWLLRYVFIPDLQILWFPFSVLKGVALVRKRGIDVIFSTSGPETNHLVAMTISALTGKPFVADFRDGWLFEPVKKVLMKDGWRCSLERRLERLVARRAAAVTTVSDPLTQHLATSYGLGPERAITVTHGFDPDEWTQVGPVERAQGRMRIVHTGSFSLSRPTVDIRSFLEALAMLPQQTRARMEVLFVGNLTAAEREAIEFAGVGDMVRVIPPVPRASSLGYQRSADLLLMIFAPELSSASTKTFEYLYSGRPVLVVALPEAAGAQIVIEAGAGWAADVRDRKAIAARLGDLFRRWEEGRLEAPRRDLDRYHRRTVTGRLAGVLGAAVGRRKPA